ncbi:M48 family metallopeptidase [Teichococcus rhizosphaerae]|nr:M48 family metallopeptidase [Pseudoroseomonas rhizosphaerae]
MEAILNRLLANWTATRADPPIELFLVADLNYGGRAHASNQIFIDLGALASAKTEDELAFLLGHEAGHVLLGHLQQRRQNNRQAQDSLVLAAETVALGTVLANSRVVGAPGGGMRLQDNTRDNDRNTIVAAASGTRILAAMYSDLGDARFSREQEAEADRFGLDLAVRAGYSPEGMLDFFRHIAASEQHRAARAAELRGTVSQAFGLGASLGLLGKGSQWQSLGSQAAGLLAPQIEEAVAQAAAPWTERYESLQLRQQGARDYEARHWPNAVDAETRPSPFAEGKPLYADVLAYQHALLAHERMARALLQNDLPAAAREADSPALRRIPLLQAMASAEVAEKEGRITHALREAERARSMPNATTSTYELLARLLLTSGQGSAALAALEEGERRFGTREPFLVTRATIQAQLRQTVALAATLQECERADPTIGTACYRASRREQEREQARSQARHAPLPSLSAPALPAAQPSALPGMLRQLLPGL